MGNKTRWKPGEEASITFKHMTNVSSQWIQSYDRFRYKPQVLPNLAKELLYNETLVLYWITLNSEENKMEVWTDNRTGATWTGDQQLGFARNDWVENQIGKMVRDNAEYIGEYSGGHSDIGSLTTEEINSKSDSEIFDEVFGTGVPDIFCWRSSSKGLDPEFIEVKGEDKLLKSQEEWFEVFYDILPGYRAKIQEP